MTKIEPKHEQTLEYVKFIREEIRFQHGLLGVRISWLLATEAFFFTAFAISRGSAQYWQLHWFWHWVVPLAAWFVALFTLPPVYATLFRILGCVFHVEFAKSISFGCIWFPNAWVLQWLLVWIHRFIASLFVGSVLVSLDHRISKLIGKSFALLRYVIR